MEQCLPQNHHSPCNLPQKAKRKLLGFEHVIRQHLPRAACCCAQGFVSSATTTQKTWKQKNTIFPVKQEFEFTCQTGIWVTFKGRYLSFASQEVFPSLPLSVALVPHSWAVSGRFLNPPGVCPGAAGLVGIVVFHQRLETLEAFSNHKDCVIPWKVC